MTEKSTTRPHGTRYPWGKWFKRESMLLIRGIDFEGMPHGMVQTIRQAAARYKVQVSLALGDLNGKQTILMRRLK